MINIHKMPAQRLSAVAAAILAMPTSTLASELPRSLKNMKDSIQNAPIHTNTQACIPEEASSNGVQVIVAFVVGLFVMFVVAYFYN